MSTPTGTTTILPEAELMLVRLYRVLAHDDVVSFYGILANAGSTEVDSAGLTRLLRSASSAMRGNNRNALVLVEANLPALLAAIVDNKRVVAETLALLGHKQTANS